MHRVIVHARYVQKGKDTEKEAVIIATRAHPSLAQVMREAAAELIEMADVIDSSPVKKE